MKKYLNFMTFVMMAVFSLTFVSCGDDDEELDPASEYVGTWSLSDSESAVYGFEYIQLKSDGSYIDVQEDEETEKGYAVYYGEWSVSGDKLILKPTSDILAGITLTYDIVKKEKNKLTVSMLGFTTTFVKVNDSVIEKYL